MARARTAQELAFFTLLTGQWGRMSDLLREALADVGDRDPDLRARIEAAAGGRFYDPRFAAEFESRLPAIRALAGGDASGPRVLGLIVAAIGACRGEIERGEVTSLVERGLGDGRLLREEGSDSLFLGQGLEALLAIDDLEAADRTSRGVLDDARRRGSVFGSWPDPVTAWSSMRSGGP